MDAKLAVDLSRQWRNGSPASTLKAAGVLLHVIDGGMGGIFHNGFANSSTGLPPPPEFLWERLERSVEEALSVSVVSRAYPHVYHPTNHESLRLGGFGSLPGVVLDAARATHRVSCCYPFDAATHKLRCAGRTCTPRCDFQGAHVGGLLQTLRRYYRYRGEFSAAFPGERLATCLAQMDLSRCTSPQGAQLTRQRHGWCPLAYNEIVLAGWRGGLGGLVRAVYAEGDAEAPAWALARELRRAAAARGVHVPLLSYNRDDERRPFSVLA